jgi:8-oxo-dGTP diphosphatase
MARPQRHPLVAVDGLVLHAGKLVAVRRKNDPYRGMPALPGGFIELGERAEEAVVREVREETGLQTRVVRLVGVFSDPRRDPRGHVISIAYGLEETGGELRAGSDAAEIVLLEPDGDVVMAFDHAAIVRSWEKS